MKRATGIWLLALAWLGAIYSTLYVARTVAELLRTHNLLRLTVWTTIALLGVAVLFWAVRARRGVRAWGVLALGAVAFLWAVASVSPPEVKLHFVEYGVLGGLFYSALRSGGARWVALPAVILTGLAGWLDEGIQYLLPNRWYDLQDVAINTVAGAIAIVTLVLLDWAQRREAAS
ncbi:MAG: VanZ family protein [Acidobacteria bacterium]|nr:VanZ family protein [Acidobacteriota bacterium]